jgi:hypothetical protein
MHPRKTVMPITRVAGVRGSFIGHKRRQGAVIRRAAGWAARKEEQEVMVVPSWLGDTFLLQMLYQRGFCNAMKNKRFN